jgi:hypothetical protein
MGLPLENSPRPSQWSAWLPGFPLLPHGPLEASYVPRKERARMPGRFDYRPTCHIPSESIIATGNCELRGGLPVYSRKHPAPRSLGQWERMTRAPSLWNCERAYSLFPNRVCNDFTRAQVRLEVALYEDLCFAIRNRELLRVEDVRTLRSTIYSYVPSAGYRYYNQRKVTIGCYRETGVLGHLVRLFLRGKSRNLSIRDKLLVGMDELATPPALAKRGRHQVTWFRPSVR